MSKSILCIALSDVQLESASMLPERVSSGNPETRSKPLVRSRTSIPNAIVWRKPSLNRSAELGGLCRSANGHTDSQI